MPPGPHNHPTRIPRGRVEGPDGVTGPETEDDEGTFYTLLSFVYNSGHTVPSSL